MENKLLKKVANFFDASGKVLESFKKVAIDLFLLLAVVVVIVSAFKHSLKKQMVIYPFKVPKGLLDQGLTGDILTARLIDRIHFIKDSGSVYYKANNLVLPSWENEVDDFKDLVKGDTYAEINAIIKSLLGTKTQNAGGEFTSSAVPKDSLFTMRFRIGNQGKLLSATDKNVDSLINKAAEFVMEQTDPYHLASWYRSTGQKAKCLRIVQQLLNDDDEKNDGLALHLRGALFLSSNDTGSNNIAIQTLKQALDKINGPWLTYSNLGVGYYNKGRFDSAALMYQKSIKSNSKTFFGYANYGNLLYGEYSRDTSKIKKLDSAIMFYLKAIDYNKQDVRLYASLIPALFAKHRISEANQYFQKAIEMDYNNVIIYRQMGKVQKKYKLYKESIINLKKAESLSTNKKINADIENDIKEDEVFMYQDSIKSTKL